MYILLYITHQPGNRWGKNRQNKQSRNVYVGTSAAANNIISQPYDKLKWYYHKHCRNKHHCHENVESYSCFCCWNHWVSNRKIRQKGDKVAGKITRWLEKSTPRESLIWSMFCFWFVHIIGRLFYSWNRTQTNSLSACLCHVANKHPCILVPTQLHPLQSALPSVMMYDTGSILILFYFI